MTQDPSPTWQPLSALPLIGSLIEGMLQEAEEHYQTLQKARPRPHVLDDDTVGRVFEVFGAQADDLWLFEEQLSRWQHVSPTSAQRQELERLSGQLTRLRGVLASILALAEELKQGTAVAPVRLVVSVVFETRRCSPDGWASSVSVFSRRTSRTQPSGPPGI